MTFSHDIVIVGAGPGIGQSVAEAFAQEGYDLALLARQPQRLAGLCGELSKKSGRRIFSYAADAAAQESLLQGVAAARADLGDPEVLVYNVAQHAQITNIKIVANQAVGHQAEDGDAGRPQADEPRQPPPAARRLSACSRRRPRLFHGTPSTRRRCRSAPSAR
jgi:NAD(P)-dependent dehydrogenase (short-subunit alcohol dehydrogenase family)